MRRRAAGAANQLAEAATTRREQARPATQASSRDSAHRRASSIAIARARRRWSRVASRHSTRPMMRRRRGRHSSASSRLYAEGARCASPRHRLIGASSACRPPSVAANEVDKLREAGHARHAGVAERRAAAAPKTPRDSGTRAPLPAQAVVARDASATKLAVAHSRRWRTGRAEAAAMARAAARARASAAACGSGGARSPITQTPRRRRQMARRVTHGVLVTRPR